MTGSGHRGGQGHDRNKSAAMNCFPFHLSSPHRGMPIYTAVTIGCLSYAASRRLALNHGNDSESIFLSRLELPSANLKHFENREPNAILGSNPITARNPTSPSPLETATMACFGSLSGSGLRLWHRLRTL